MQVDAQTVKETADATVQLYRLAGPILVGFCIFATIVFLYLIITQWLSAKSKSATDVLLQSLADGQRELVSAVERHQDENRADSDRREERMLEELKMHRQLTGRMSARSLKKDLEFIGIMHGFKDGMGRIDMRLAAVEGKLNLPSGGTTVIMPQPSQAQALQHKESEGA